MSQTYIPLSTTTLSSTSSTVTFSNIPSTYTDLVLSSGNVTTRIDDILIRFNSDTGSNYSRTYIAANGSGTETGRSVNATSIAGGYYPTGTQGYTNVINIMNYSNMTTYKTSLIRYSQIGSWFGQLATLWRSTAAINTITLTTGTSTFNVGSTFTLYGIKAE